MALRAGVLALLVHTLFFFLLVMGFNWRSEQPVRIDDVQLWDSLPAPKVQSPPPPPEPVKPVPKVEPKPEMPPPPPAPAKAEIVLKKKPPEPKPEKKKETPPKEDLAQKKKEAEQKKIAEEKKRQELLRKLQQEMLKDDIAHEAMSDEAKQLQAARNAEQARKAAAAAQGEVDEYKARIKQKIYSRMNRQPCGNAVPVYSIALLPTGEVAGTPRLVTTSGIAACDDAALRAIMQAQPLPLPPDSELFSNFRDLTIPFKPDQATQQ